MWGQTFHQKAHRNRRENRKSAPKSALALAEALELYHDEVEADFQEYYYLDLDQELRRGFARTARLFAQLPAHSRVMEKLNPIKDWDFDRETQAQILRRLDVISDQLAKFGSKKKVETPKPFEPEYVTKGKKKLAERQEEAKRWSEADKHKLADFFAKHNSRVKRIE